MNKTWELLLSRMDSISTMYYKVMWIMEALTIGIHRVHRNKDSIRKYNHWIWGLYSNLIINHTCQILVTLYLQEETTVGRSVSQLRKLAKMKRTRNLNWSKPINNRSGKIKSLTEVRIFLNFILEIKGIINAKSLDLTTTDMIPSSAYMSPSNGKEQVFSAKNSIFNQQSKLFFIFMCLV